LSIGLYPSMYFECSAFNYPHNPAHAPVVVFCRMRQSFEDQSVCVCVCHSRRFNSREDVSRLIWNQSLTTPNGAFVSVL